MNHELLIQYITTLFEEIVNRSKQSMIALVFRICEMKRVIPFKCHPSQYSFPGSMIVEIVSEGKCSFGTFSQFLHLRYCK